MSSRKEEERNEKIIRGLMKLPPNRRCINCNSLGPQYVCTNFWTFVCTPCSGIHREFTHRVKSVSMSKFTSQEVEALQKGGNQRARDIYLKEWDLQRQRLPDSSNVDKVREFIKNVYVDKKYAGGKTSDKPPRDLQSIRSLEDETRRASSYHSYSQSPPYDYQYEERRYGKQGAVLTRRPGSDRGHYEAKISNFVYSPGRLREQMPEDRFANEGTGSFKSGTQSPNFQKDTGFGSPSSQPNTISEAKVKGGADGIQGPQRTTSSGSFGSFDSNSLKSVNSSNLMDVVPEPEQSWGMQQNKMSTFPSLMQSSYSGNSGSFNHSEAPIVTQPSASTIDLFQLPAASSAVDLLQSSSISSSSSVNLSGPPQTSSTTSLGSLFENSQEQPIASLDKNSPQLSVSKDEGWATFDIPQPTASNLVNQYLTPRELSSSDSDGLGKSNSLSPSNTSMQWPSFQNTNFQGTSSSMSTSWYEGLQNNQASANATNPQSWNAFEDSIGNLPLEKTQESSQQQVTSPPPSSFVNQYLDMGVSEDFTREETQRAVSDGGSAAPNATSYVVPGFSHAPSSVPVTGMQSHATEIKSTNPFDLDSDSEPSDMFLDMSSLQAALPNAPLPSSFLGGVTEPWFPQNSVTPYIPATAQGGLAYIAGQAPSSQLPNVPAQGSVASIGGNPFA